MRQIHIKCWYWTKTSILLKWDQTKLSNWYKRQQYQSQLKSSYLQLQKYLYLLKIVKCFINITVTLFHWMIKCKQLNCLQTIYIWGIWLTSATTLMVFCCGVLFETTEGGTSFISCFFKRDLSISTSCSNAFVYNLHLASSCSTASLCCFSFKSLCSDCVLTDKTTPKIT